MNNLQKLDIFRHRLEKLNIHIKLSSNVPWIYLDKINDKLVKEKYNSEYGYTIGYYPTKLGAQFEFTDLKEIFKLIRKYK